MARELLKSGTVAKTVPDKFVATRTQDCGLKERYAAEAPKDSREALCQLGLQGGLRIMLLQEFRPKLVKIVGALTDNDEGLCRQAVLP